MSDSNEAWALEQIDLFLDMITYEDTDPDPFITGEEVSFSRRRKNEASDDEIIAQWVKVDHIIRTRFNDWDNVINSLTTPTGTAFGHWGHFTWQLWNGVREYVVYARSFIASWKELEENLGDDAPELSASEFHPWIWEGAQSLWNSGHYRWAVEGAIRKLNAETQNKLGRRDVSETNLFIQAFSTDKPKPDQPRLRRMENDRRETYKSVQRGAMSFAEGIFAGIRNPLAHEADQDLSEQQALEYLAALSVLARWVDDSKLETAQ